MPRATIPDLVLGVDEYINTMYHLSKKGWFISKASETAKQWTFTLTGRDKTTRRVIVKKPVSSNKE